jgi:hypothetical protein
LFLTWTGWIFGLIGVIGLIIQWIVARNQNRDRVAELKKQEAYAEEQKAHAAKVEAHNKVLQEQLAAMRQESAAMRQESKETGADLHQTIEERVGPPPVWVLPDNTDRAAGFVGRQEILSWIIGIHVADPKHRIAILYGRPGIGKSRIALRLAHLVRPNSEHPYRGDGLLWSELGPAPGGTNILKVWYKEAGGLGDNPADLPNKLGDRRPLVIIDDARSLADVTELIKATHECPTLITTSDESVADEIDDAYPEAIKREVRDLTPEEAGDLLGEQMEPIMGRLPPGYIERLTRRVDLDPFTLIQLGSYFNDTLKKQGAATAWQAGDLDNVLFKALSQPDMGARQGTHVGHEQDITGVKLYRARIQESLDSPGAEPGAKPLDDEARKILRLMSVLRPRPESFSAAEIAELSGDALDAEAAAANLDEMARRSFVIREVSAAGEVAEDNAARYSLHRLARRVISTLLPVGQAEAAAIHGRAIDYWSAAVDPNLEDTPSYLTALNRQGYAWLRGSRNLLYHLGQLEDRHQARLTFDKVYFELFWWWGAYLRYPELEDLLDDWKLSERKYRDEGEQEEDEQWFRALTRFHREYRPAHDGTFFKESDLRQNDRDWPEVELTLSKILAIDHLDGDPGRLATHAEWHTRMLVEFFRADARRYSGQPEHALESHAVVRELLERCVTQENTDNEDCSWNLAWLDYEEADLALDLAAGDATQYAKAVDEAASSIRLVLENEPEDGGGEPSLLPRKKIDDWEILALACCAWGDAVFASVRPVAATHYYQAAAVFAFAWQYYQGTEPSTDHYTQAFYGDILRHIVGKLQSARSKDPAQAAEIVSGFLEISDAFGARAGDSAPAAAPGPGDLAEYLQHSFRLQAFGIDPEWAAYKHLDTEPAALSGTVDRMLAMLWDDLRSTTPPPERAIPAKGQAPAASQ